MADTPQGNLAPLIRAFEQGDRRALSRLITEVESGWDPAALLSGVQAPQVKSTGGSTGRHLKIGITGSAGAGKSTLIAALIRQLRQINKRVSVLACDPSSA